MTGMDAAEPHSGSFAPTVTVRGHALLRVEPDEAVLWITLTSLQDAPGAALSDVSARSRVLIGLLDEVGIGGADRSTAGIGVAEEFDHTERGRRSLGHRAVARISVRLTDPDLIGRLITQATDELAARIDGPHWLISLDNPVRLEAARQAAAAARRKAEAYADGVGAKLGRLIELTESGEPHVRPGFAPVRAAIAMHAAEPMPVESGEHEVTASIQATFELELG